MGAIHQMKARFHGGSENSYGISLAAVPVELIRHAVKCREECQNSIQWAPVEAAVVVTGVEIEDAGAVDLVVVGQNLMRRVDGEGATSQQQGIVVGTMSKGLFEENNIDVLGVNNGIRYATGVIRTFNNRTPSGAVVEAYNTAAGSHAPDIAAEIENSMLCL